MSPLPHQPDPVRHPDPTRQPGAPAPAGPPAPPGPPDPTRPPGPPAQPGPLDLDDRLLAHRIVLVGGVLDHAAADRAAARLLLLDADGPEPVELHLRCPDGELDAAATLADAVETAHVPVRAVVGGALGGAAVGVLAAADERVASASCVIALTEPRAPSGHGRADELAVVAQRAERLVAQLRRRLAEASGRPLDRVADDLRRGLVLSAREALDYGLVSSVR